MLRTSSQEGGLQQRTESPKATSGVPNGFVRPVAVASIFRPALGGSSGVSAVDGKPDEPEKRRSSTAKGKVFGSSLSSDEFSRRRQSFDAKTLGQNVLKGDRSSPSRTLPDFESFREPIDEANEKCEENYEGTKKYSETQNAGYKKSKDDITTAGKSVANLKTEEKEKNTKNAPRSSKSDKTSVPGSIGSGVTKGVTSIEDNAPSIQNGILDESEIATVVRRPRSRNTCTPDSFQKYDTPQTERRRRNKPLLSACAEKESASDSTKAETLTKDDTPSSRNEVSTISSEITSSKNVTECAQQPGAVFPERRRRDRTSQSVSTEQTRNAKDSQVTGKEPPLQKIHEANYSLVSEGSSVASTKSELQTGSGKPELLDENKGSVEALDTQSPGKFRTCRRTSDVIAAKIQTIFSKSDKPLTLPSTNKLSSSRSKSGTSLTEKEQKPEISPTEKNNTSQAISEQKVSLEKSIDRKEGNSKISSNDQAISGDVNVSNKSSLTKKQQNAKCPEAVEAAISSENKSKQATKTRSETGNSAVKSDTSQPSVDKEKFAVRSCVKDSKFNQKSDDAPSLSARSTISTPTDNDKNSVKPEVFPRGAGNTVITRKEVSASGKEPVSNSSSKEEKPVTKRPSINFFIAEVSVENAPLPQKNTSGKISPLQITSLSVEEKSYVTQKLHANKTVSDASEVAPKSEVINSDAVTSKFSGKSKTGSKLFPLKEEISKVSSANQQPKSNFTQKSTAVENTNSEAKTPEKGQVGKALLPKEENKVLAENLTPKNSQTQKSSTVYTTSSETKTTKSEVVNSRAVTLKTSENKASKTVLSKEENKVLPVSGNLQEKSSQVHKSVVVESSTSGTKAVKITESDTLNSRAVVPTSSEKGKVDKTISSKEGNKVQAEKNNQVCKLAAEKIVTDDTKASNSVLVNSGSSAVKTAGKDKLGKALPLKEENRGTTDSTPQKNNQTQKIGADVTVGSGTKVQALKLSEKDKTDSALPVQERNKLESENLRNKSAEVKKSNAEGKLDTKTQSSEVARSGARAPSKPLEKDKLGTPLTSKDSKVSSEVLKQKTGQLQKSGAEVKTSIENLAPCDLVKSGTQAPKPSEKDKLGTPLASKDSKVSNEVLKQKTGQLQKSGAEVKTSIGNLAPCDLAKSGTQAPKPSEKDKLGTPLASKDSKVSSEVLKQKSGQLQKSGAEVKTSIENLAPCDLVKSGTQAPKPSEKDKLGTPLASKDSKVSSEVLKQKTGQLQKSGAEVKTSIGNLAPCDLAKSGTQAPKPSEKDKLGTPLASKDSKVSSEVLKQKTGQLQKSGAEVKTSIENLAPCDLVKSGTQALKQSEKDKTEKTVALKEVNKGISENLQHKSDQVEKCVGESDRKGSELVNSGSEKLEKDKIAEGGSQPKETKVGPENLNKRSDIFLKWAAKENAGSAVKVGPTKNTAVVSDMSYKQLASTSKTSSQKSEMPSENVKQVSSSVQKVSTDKSTPKDSNIETAVPNSVPLKSSKVGDGKEQPVEVKTKPVNSVVAIQNPEQPKGEDKVCSQVKQNLKEEQKLDETAKYADVKKLTPVKKTTPSVNECPQTEGTAKLPPTGKRVETTHSSIISQSTTIKSEKPEEVKQLPMHLRGFSTPQTGGTAQKLNAANTELKIQRDELKTVVPGQVEKAKSTDTVLTSSSLATESASETKNSAVSVQPTKDFILSAKAELKEQKPPSENSYFRSRTQEIYSDSRKISGVLSASEKDLDDLDDITSNDMLSAVGFSSVFNPEFPGRSSSYSKFDAPRPPERKRLGYLRETSALTSPPRVPLRSMTRTGSLKHPDDSRFPMERTLAVLRSSSHSVLGPSYTPQRISYTEMLSKLGTCGRNPTSTTSNRKFGTSQVSELWADLGEEQANSAHTSEMLESETSERMRLEKEVLELQSRYSQVQQKSDKMEMEMMEARVYRATEVNGDLSEDEESDATASIYKQKYERAVRDMEIMKRRLQQQHEEEMEQSLMLKKAADKRLTEALEDVEEERQVVNQWKRKAQKLGAELQDLRLMLEEQMARNGELEKKQRRFDAELSAAQEEIRKEHQLREKLTRDKEQSQLEKYSLEQELQATRLDMDMQHEKIALLNRELDELSLSSKGEEEVTQLKRAKQELERKTRDQEEELEELAGQVQMLEQAKLRLEMSLEKLRQEHRRESSVRDEEIEELRASSSKKIKNLEAQLENEQEERHQLVKQKHELERRIIELSDLPPPQDPEIERRLRRDLKRTKALLRDAQSMLEHTRDGQANKTLIRQLKNQLEDAEFTKSVAIKARQTAELELQELQSQLEEVTRTKNDMESRCLQMSREKSALQTQLEEIEEEMAEVMKKYKASVAQMSIDQKSLAEQTQQISELECERLTLKEQLAEVSTKLDHISVQTEDSARVHRLDAKVRDLESKLELEQTTRSRIEHQIARLKEQCDRSREECDSLRNKELQAQEGTRRLQRQLRELREDYAALQQKESEAYRKQHELEMALENTEADLQVTKNDLRLACQRIQDLQSALEDDLDSGTDVPDESGSDTDSSLDVSVLSRQCLTPLQRSDSVSSNTSIGSDRQFRALSHSQDVAFFSRMMQTRMSMDFLI